MKKVLYLAVLFSLLTLNSQAAPRMAVPEPEFDFGYVPRQSKVVHSYWLHSVGTVPVKVEEINPGCGCTKAPLEKDIIDVDDSTRLEIIYSTRTYRGMQSKEPKIRTNSGQGWINLKFTADVLMYDDSTYPALFDPVKIDVSQFGKEPRTSAEFMIHNISDEDLKIDLIDIREDIFDIDLPRKVKSNDSAVAVISVKDDFVDQNFEQSVTIEFSDEARSRFTLPITRTVRTE